MFADLFTQAQRCGMAPYCHWSLTVLSSGVEGSQTYLATKPRAGDATPHVLVRHVGHGHFAALVPRPGAQRSSPAATVANIRAAFVKAGGAFNPASRAEAISASIVKDRTDALGLPRSSKLSGVLLAARAKIYRRRTSTPLDEAAE